MDDVSGGAIGEEKMVRALLGAAGLDVPDDEVDRLAKLYPGLRRTVDCYYRVPVGDEVTAAVYRAVDSTPGDER